MTANSPCNCNDASFATALDDLTALDTLPSLESLDAELDALSLTALDAGSELDLAFADSQLDPEEELAFASVESTAQPSLDALVAVLQQYPGLKLSLSF